MEDYILKMENISKTFPGVKALDNVSLHVKRGEVHCLIGANGAGKSTLMKVLAGVYQSDDGTIYFDGQQMKIVDTLFAKRKGISMIYQELSLVSELSAAENIFINNFPRSKSGAINWRKTVENAEALAKSLDLNINVRARTATLSIGQRQLVELMKCLASNSKLIVMDEPSATLSQEEFKILVKTIKDLKEKGITIIYISHRLEELFTVGDTITVLRDGKNVVSEPVDQMDIKKLVQFMIGKEIQTDSEWKMRHKVEKEIVLQGIGLTNHKLKDASITLRKGEIHGIYGLVGSGRTEILRAFFGVDKIESGKVIYKGQEVNFKQPAHAIKKGLGLLPENRKVQGLVLGLQVWQNISMVALRKYLKNGIINYKKVFEKSNDYVQKLGVKTPSIRTETRNLSGGNQQKVILAKWMDQDCDVLLVDEPTQGIDVGAKDEIYKLLKKSASDGKSLLVVSSELEELLQLCDSITVMFDGKVVCELSGADISEDVILHNAIVGR